MNKYKIEFKQTFKKKITIFAEDESEAMDIVEQAYLKTNLLDNSYKDLEKIETKIVEKNNEKVEDNSIKLEENEIILDEDDIEYLEDLADEMEEILDEMREVLEENKEENL